MTQLEQWGCPWSRRPDGSVNVRRFGGMKIERTRFAADKTGFHMLHTLFQTSLQFPQIQRFDEHFVLDLLVDDGQARGPVAMNMMEGTRCRSALTPWCWLPAAPGASTATTPTAASSPVTGWGWPGTRRARAEFVQYHPTGLPGSGILMTEGCRGEGGILVNKNGYRYLQDYGMGPKPRSANRRINIWSWAHATKCPSLLARVAEREHHPDAARRRGLPRSPPPRREKLLERLPFICELAKAYVGVDPVKEPIPVRPTAHYTMGGIETDQQCETRIKGCLPWANARPLAYMAPTVWAPTRWPSWWSSAARPGSRPCSAPLRRARQTAPPSMRRLPMWSSA